MLKGTFIYGKRIQNLCVAATAMVSLFLYSACSATPAKSEPDIQLEKQRQAFKTAREALQRGDVAGYRELEPSLVSYPLYPYLRYQELRGRLTEAKPEEIRTFLIQFPDTPVTVQLRRAWLMQLAQGGRWRQYVEDYGGMQDPSLRCHYASALIHTGKKEEGWQEIDSLWISPKSQPRECDAPFSAWRKAGQMTREKVLARMELAVDRKDARLVSHLADFLPKKDRPWVKRWEGVRRSPQAELDSLSPDNEESYWSARLYTYGIRRLANLDVDAAASAWDDREKYRLSPDQVLIAERALAMNLAMQRRPEGSERLAALAKKGVDDPNVRQWSVRAALWQQDWPQVLATLETLTQEEQGEDEWLYWRARALEALGRKGEAAVFFNLVSKERSFYGFAAAARLKRAPNITTEPLPVSDKERETMRQSPAIQRVRELTHLGMTLEARREWRDAVTRFNPQSLRVAARIAHDWGWYDQAIIALGRSNQLNDLEVRFPTPFRDEVESAAERRNLDPAFVYAVMRQESAFGVTARSPVGALGLMQLMPATARQTARSINERLPTTSDLLKAEKNILLGTTYLSGLLDQFDGNRFFALAAYNAGPHRVTRWQPTASPVPADIWVANVTFSETRQYVERILAYTAVYEWRLGRSVTPLSNWLGDAPPRLIREASVSMPPS